MLEYWSDGSRSSKTAIAGSFLFLFAPFAFSAAKS